jgi:hypothetical protein
MLNLKQVTLDLKYAHGKDLRAYLSMQNIQAVMMKGTIRQRVGDENGNL